MQGFCAKYKAHHYNLLMHLLYLLGRLCFDARGEADLRPPKTSNIALVEDKPEHEYNPGGAQQPEACTLLLSARGHKYYHYITSYGHFQVTVLAVTHCCNALLCCHLACRQDAFMARHGKAVEAQKKLKAIEHPIVGS